MLPQNGQHPQRGQQQMQGYPSFPSQGGFEGGAGLYGMDPGEMAKQMKALNAVGHARVSTNARGPPASAGGTSSGTYFGGINPPYPPQSHDALSSSSSAHAIHQNHAAPPMSNPSLLEPSMSQHPNARNMLQRQHAFLTGVHNLHLKRGTPLPPALTGIQNPSFDHAAPHWNAIEPGSEPGSFKLANKDVNLFKMWGLVFQHGGFETMTSNGTWTQLLPQFDLPEEFPFSNGATSVATMLAQYYRAILFPFEESYKKNMQETQRKANMANQQGNMNQNMAQRGMPGGPQAGMNNNPMAMQQRMGMNPMNQGATPGPHNMAQPPNGAQRFPMNQPPPQRPQSAMMIPPGGDAMLPVGQIPEVSLLDQDVQGIKRKLDSNDLDNKRVRPRTDGPDGTPMSLGALDRHPSEPPVHPSQMTHSTPPNVVRPRQQPSRRKIEYIPLAREVDTYGGRDLKLIENEYANSNGRRIREINEWGPIDIEHLTLSIRSRLSTELSWGLTAFSLLSTMRGQQPGSGFPIMQCPDLLEEILDLAEDLAFDGPEYSPDDQLFHEPLEIHTHRQLTNVVLERHLQPFAALEKYQGSKDAVVGPMQRPANYVLAVVNIIRNLSTVNDNIQWLSRHERTIDLLLRLGTVVIKDGVPTPASPALSLSDLVEIRKDTIYTLSALAEHIPAPPTNPLSKDVLRMARRTIELAASYLVDPVDAVSPLACVQRAGHPLNPHIRPPLFTDMALELLVHFIMPDANRQAVAKAVPSSSLWTLFESLVHRMPVVDSDFQMMVQDVWLSHIHDLTMAIYSLVFLAPPDLKQRMLTDRRLGFKNIMLRLLQRFLTTPEVRPRFYLTARRIVETLKALDDSVDPFENPVDSSVPALSFGMGFADSNDSGQEKGTGLLGAHRDLGWEILNMREVQGDDLMFRELESLVRIECQ